jgi:hypothetical protein
MDDAALLAALLELAEELALPVRRLSSDSPFEGLVPAQSGVCLLRGRRIVLLAASDPPERQIEVLARALRAHAGASLEMRFLPPAIRECLDRGA